MSSLDVPLEPIVLEEDPPAIEQQSAEIPAVTVKPVTLPLMRVEDPLKAVTRRALVTWMLVAANGWLFAGMALMQQRMFDFSSHCLLIWGGGLAPRVFGEEWWRAASYMFVHGDLAHLANNMLFLLLVGPFVERLLGSPRFALVYLFAGLGGGLLSMGTSPQHVVVGASAAVFGIYGALLGCCLRGPRSISWRMVGQRAGVLLVYTVLSLLIDWFDFTRQPIAHLGGFAFGLAGGFLCGHKLQPRAARWRLWRLGVVVSICVGLISLTAWGVYNCSSKALECYQQYAAIKDRERELQGQFHDVMLQWEQNKLTNAAFSQALQNRLIPALQEMRATHGLKLTGKLADMEKQSFPMQEFWKALRPLRGEVKERNRKPLTLQEFGEMYRVLCKVRVDTWRALADELNNKHSHAARALLDNRELDLLAFGLDQCLNENNPLYRWLELSRGRRQFDD